MHGCSCTQGTRCTGCCCTWGMGSTDRAMQQDRQYEEHRHLLQRRKRTPFQCSRVEGGCG